jgi:hypothetical protein
MTDKPKIYTPKITINLTSEDLERLVKEGEKLRQETVERTRSTTFLTGEDLKRRVR